MSYSLNQLYKVVGISKQAVNQYAKRQAVFDEQVLLLKAKRFDKNIQVVELKRYYTLKPNFIGRDKFVDLFMDLGFRIKRKKNYHRTTTASKLYYPNLIQGMLLHSPAKLAKRHYLY
ncbi:MAG: hypothetical protein R2801_01855 [Chitinophagales bacterium]